MIPKRSFKMGALFFAGLIVLFGSDQLKALIGIVDSDDRFPYVVKLIADFEPELGGCTGVVAGNGQLVSTAAHCVWRSGYAKNIRIIFRDADDIPRTVMAKKIFIPESYASAQNHFDSTNDRPDTDEDRQIAFFRATVSDIAYIVPEEPIQTLGYAHWATELLIPASDSGHDTGNGILSEMISGSLQGKSGSNLWTDTFRTQLIERLRVEVGDLANARVMLVGFGQTGCLETDKSCEKWGTRRFAETTLLPTVISGGGVRFSAPWIWCTGTNESGMNPARHGDSGGPLFIRALDGRWLFVGYTSRGNDVFSCASSIFYNLSTWELALREPGPFSSNQFIQDGGNPADIGARSWPQKQTLLFFKEILEIWSSPNPEAIPRLKNVYSVGGVTFHGKDNVSLDSIYNEKSNLFEQWPHRNFKMQLGSSPKIDCEIRWKTTLCGIRANVEWTLSKNRTKIESSGVTELQFEINLEGMQQDQFLEATGPKIILENHKIISAH